MSLKITDKILSIPPYISTCWSQVASLHMKGSDLVITLSSGNSLQIPNLATDVIESVFQNHSLYLEKLSQKTKDEKGDISSLQEMMKQQSSSVRFAFGPSAEAIEGMMQHNPAQSNAPNLPQEILSKIGMIAKILAPTEDVSFPEAHEGCNCYFCQVARAFQQSSPEPQEFEETVADDELQFQQWNVQQQSDKLYSVSNRLDAHERYQVYLGETIGCTCGTSGCEHVLAVLKT